MEPLGYELEMTHVLSPLARVKAARGDLPAAREELTATLRARDRLGATLDAAEDRLALAELALVEGDLRAAQRLASDASEVFRRDRDGGREARARLVLARVFLARGEVAHAREEFARAEAERGQSEDLRLALEAAVVGARITAASGDPLGAIGELEAAAGRAERAGLRLAGFEARLALGEAEIAAGRVAEGRRRLAAVEAETQAAGLRLLARRAAAARAASAS